MSQNTVKTYRLCVADSVDELNEEVSDYLDEGWELYGSPSIVLGQVDEIYFYQALTIEEKRL